MPLSFDENMMAGKLDGKPTKIKWKEHALFTLYFNFWRNFLLKFTRYTQAPVFFMSYCFTLATYSATINNKNDGKNCYLDNFVFFSPSPSQRCWGTIRKTCVKQCYRFATLYRGRGGILNTLFKITITFRHCL